MDLNQLILDASSRIKPFIRKTTFPIRRFFKIIRWRVYLNLRTKKLLVHLRQEALNKILTIKDAEKD